jgi:hypothetical protein
MGLRDGGLRAVVAVAPISMPRLRPIGRRG